MECGDIFATVFEILWALLKKVMVVLEYSTEFYLAFSIFQRLLTWKNFIHYKISFTTLGKIMHYVRVRDIPMQLLDQKISSEMAARKGWIE